MKVKLLRIFGVVLFTFCLLLSVAYNGLAFWSDLEGMSFWGYPESNSYDPEIETDGRLHNLICPVLVTSSEVAIVRVKVSNPKDFPITPIIQASISNPSVQDNLVRDKQTLALAAGETVELSWQVGKENILFGRVIFARVYLFQSAYHPPSATAHCGIMVRDLGGLSGVQLSIFVIGASLIGMLAGALIWWSAREGVQNISKIFGIFAWLLALTIVNFFANFLGLMLIAGLLVLLTTLSFLAIMEALLLNKL
jgi:hypothetical protein